MSSDMYFTAEPQSLVQDIDLRSFANLTTNLTTELVSQKPTDIWRYAFHDYWKAEGCPHVTYLPLLGGGPLAVLVIMSSYLIFVMKIGPHMMKTRPAMELKGPMLVYNTLMVVFNAYFFFKFVGYSNYGQIFTDFQFPNKYDDSVANQALIQTLYLYFLTKFVDLLDTVFFVLRKRDRQITGLHLYHHTVVPLLVWLTMKLMPTVPAYQLFGLLNSLVHTIMYSYYALAALGPAIQPYLWWKKYITQIQIIQFVIFIAYSLVLGKFQTGYPAVWFWIGFIQSPLFFYMFTDFYIQSYRKARIARKAL